MVIQGEHIISQMRFGHVGLNNKLAIINKHADGLCVCGCSQETIDRSCSRAVSNVSSANKDTL